jgi:putative membrane protein
LNWKPVEVKVWEGLIIETKIPALVVIAFLIGLVPMWLVHRTSRWNYDRRIASLESAARASAMAHPAPTSAPLAEEPRADLTPTDETKPAP